MKIAGFQKTTLIDYPGQVACTIFLYGCNFRCGFCYNPNLVSKKLEKEFSEEEIFDFLKKRRGIVDAVCITGGEALMSLDFNFLRKIRDLGYLIKLDTNGSFPEKLKEIIKLNLVDYIAMDIKSSPENYSKIVSAKIDLKKLEESIKLIHSFGNYEFRTTVVSRIHNAFEMRAIGRWLTGLIGKPNKYYLQGFQSTNEMVDERFKSELSTTKEFLEETRDSVKEYFKEVLIRV